MKFRTFVSAGLLLCLIFGGGAFSHALEIPVRPEDYVTDRAAMLSPSARAELNRALKQFEAQTSNQVAVVTFASAEEESLEDFSIRLAEKWKLGQKGKDNGVILLIFKQERLIRIEVGYGLEGSLPDALAGLIISREMAPLFREGDYETGIARGVQAILQAVQGEYKVQASGLDGQGAHPDMGAQYRALFLLIMLVVLVLFLTDLFRYRTYLNNHRVYASRYSFWEWFFRFALLLAVLSILFRIAFYTALMSRGGYSGGRGGGFSGGGGSFGGGGASGGW